MLDDAVTEKVHAVITACLDDDAPALVADLIETHYVEGDLRSVTYGLAAFISGVMTSAAERDGDPGDAQSIWAQYLADDRAGT